MADDQPNRHPSEQSSRGTRIPDAATTPPFVDYRQSPNAGQAGAFVGRSSGPSYDDPNPGDDHTHQPPRPDVGDRYTLNGLDSPTGHLRPGAEPLSPGHVPWDLDGSAWSRPSGPEES